LDRVAVCPRRAVATGVTPVRGEWVSRVSWGCGQDAAPTPTLATHAEPQSTRSALCVSRVRVWLAWPSGAMAVPVDRSAGRAPRCAGAAPGEVTGALHRRPLASPVVSGASPPGSPLEGERSWRGDAPCWRCGGGCLLADGLGFGLGLGFGSLLILICESCGTCDRSQPPCVAIHNTNRTRPSVASAGALHPHSTSVATCSWR